MDSITLRKLTLKSTLKFGRFSEWTVEKAIELKGRRAINYLRWAYFNNSKISFTDEVLLNTLKINASDFISKPGVLKNNSYIKEKYYPSKDKIPFMKEEGILVKGSAIRRDKIAFSKGKLQRMNQGK